MNTQPLPTRHQPETIQEALTAQLAKWVDSLKLGENEKSDFHIGTPRKIDPEKGILTQAFVVEVSRQMERVSEPVEVKPLPPIPAPNTVVS